MNRFKLLVPAFLLAGVFLHADYPRIMELKNSDAVFRQLQEDIVRYNKAQSRGDPPPPLVLYTYTPTKDDETIFFLAARFTLSLESLASLNGLDRRAGALVNKPLLVPSVPGIFVREHPKNTLDTIFASWRDPRQAQKLTIRSEIFYFFPGDRFHPVERAFFLNALFAFPLDTLTVSSRYGTRVSPITGRLHFHNGIDFAAPRGSRVYAARDGTVTYRGYNSVLGNHIILSHKGGFETVYGHLDSIEVELNQTVNSGIFIGCVGSTGASTGPHLHFEIRERGTSLNPESLLPKYIKP